MIRTSPKILIDTVLDALEERVRKANSEEPIVQAFISWIDPARETPCSSLTSLAEIAQRREGAGFTHRDVAVLGFASSTIPAGADCHAWFRDRLRWMQGRRFFRPNRALSFEIDGLSILGVAAGVARLESSSEKESAQHWLTDIINQSLQRAPGESWERSLRKVAALLIASPGAGGQSLPDVDDDLLTALAAKGMIQIPGEVEERARTLILTLDCRTEGADRAAAQLHALRWLLRQAATVIPTQATVDDLIAVLEAVPSGLRRWTWENKPRTKRAGATAVKWDVQNEYHVQNLLWALLAPIFPDLEDEEYLRSLGHKHPKCDLAVPSLHVIIEVKFVLNGEQADFANVIEGVAADTSLYLSERTDFSQIVAFVWDNSRRSEQHSELLQGLRRIRGIKDAVVVQRPGGWV
jgi:DpnII restriction endonuclease